MRAIIASWLLACALLSGCEKPQAFNAVDITGASGYGTDFRMTDHNGTARTMADFRGKVVVLFFGYTHCPDVCPTTMSDMRQAMQKLGRNAERVQVLFVTVDPARDTPALLAQYVPSFNPTFLGMYGDDAATARIAKDFKIYYKRQAGSTPDTYSVDHTAGTLVFDPQGRLRLFINYGMDADKIAADLQRLL
jgi:protein SCO1/2